MNLFQLHAHHGALPHSWVITLVVTLGTVAILTYFNRNRKRFDVCGKVVVITGAATGIGAAIADKLSYKGATLVLLDIRKAALDETIAALKAKHNGNETQIYGYECDISNQKMVEEVSAKVRKTVAPQKVSVLINNAGIVIGKDLTKISVQEIRRTFEINVLGQFWVIKSYLNDLMATESGMLVTMASMMGMLSATQLVDYCSSKAANIGMHNSLRLELVQTAPNVHTLLVCPYLVASGMFNGAFDNLRHIQALLPAVSVDELASNVVYAMERKRYELVGGANGVRGLFLAWAPFLLTFLPIVLKDFAQATMNGMSTFKGRGNNWNLKRL